MTLISMTRSFRRRLKPLIRPVYDELTLFALSYTCILFFATSASSFHKEGDLLPVFLMVAAGVTLPLYHAFSKREKERLEKQVMYLCAAFINGFSGVWGGTYLLSKSESWSWILIFPVLNIVTAYLMAGEIRYWVLDERCIDDRNVRASEVALSALVITLCFVTAHFYRLHWSATLSLCVTYGTNLNRMIVNFLLPEKKPL